MGTSEGKTCRSCVERVHLSRVNTQISFPLTKVMVQGVSLNNRGADACDPDSSTLNGTREGKLGGHRFSRSVQYFNTLDATVRRIIKQQGHGACRSVSAFRPLLPLGGCGQICMKNAGRATTKMPDALPFSFPIKRRTMVIPENHQVTRHVDFKHQKSKTTKK